MHAVSQLMCCKIFFRIQPLLQERVQQLAAEVAQRISVSASVVYLQLLDVPRYVHRCAEDT